VTDYRFRTLAMPQGRADADKAVRLDILGSLANGEIFVVDIPFTIGQYTLRTTSVKSVK
jgi:hypothetical protein